MCGNRHTIICDHRVRVGSAYRSCADQVIIHLMVCCAEKPLERPQAAAAEAGLLERDPHGGGPPRLPGAGAAQPVQGRLRDGRVRRRRRGERHTGAHTGARLGSTPYHRSSDSLPTWQAHLRTLEVCNTCAYNSVKCSSHADGGQSAVVRVDLPTACVGQSCRPCPKGVISIRTDVLVT